MGWYQQSELEVLVLVSNFRFLWYSYVYLQECWLLVLLLESEVRKKKNSAAQKVEMQHALLTVFDGFGWHEKKVWDVRGTLRALDAGKVQHFGGMQEKKSLFSASYQSHRFQLEVC